MTDLERILVCAVAALVLHGVLALVLEQLPEQAVVPPPAKVSIRVEERPPPPPPPEPPEPPKPPEPKPPPPKEPVHEAPRPHPVHAAVQAAPPKDTPPPLHPPVTTDTTDEPVFGTTMESTSSAGTGPAVPIGNTPSKDVGPGTAGPVKPLAEPVQAFEATKMPMPRGDCSGKYNDEALKAGVEGTVVLDVVVGEDGRVRDIHVMSGLTHGLSEAAIAALKACRFTPGEKDGKPVPVRIRGFKVTFQLPESSAP